MTSTLHESLCGERCRDKWLFLGGVALLPETRPAFASCPLSPRDIRHSVEVTHHSWVRGGAWKWGMGDIRINRSDLTHCRTCPLLRGDLSVALRAWLPRSSHWYLNSFCWAVLWMKKKEGHSRARAESGLSWGRARQSRARDALRDEGGSTGTSSSRKAVHSCCGD